LSTAVTQGADSILLKVLLDSKWFAPVERASLQNLLTERKILQSSIIDKDEKATPLPSVAPAVVIIEGNIVSYDSNTQTGGTGLQILGVGASTSYREDRVTISMRLVDIDNGLILHNVVSTKRVLSRKLDTGIFSYVDADKILEAEAGYTFNEPSHIAVTEAIESALINLIAEGVISGSLQLADAEDVQSEVFDRFLTQNERQEFLNERRLAKARQTEQKKYAQTIRKRMRDGLVSLNEYKLSVEKQRSRRIKPTPKFKTTVASIQTVKEQASQATQPDKVAVVTSARSNASPVKANNPVAVPSPEKLIADQSRAILRAQAETQVKATQQAHQAALYAQQLILRHDAELRAKRLSQTSELPPADPASNSNLTELTDKQKEVSGS